jgi:hypothetical protein
MDTPERVALLAAVGVAVVMASFFLSLERAARQAGEAYYPPLDGGVTAPRKCAWLLRA